MYCKKCGAKISDTSRFCSECGASVNYQQKELISLTCQKCGGKLKAKDGEPMLYCPYCGEKALISESDRVTVQRIWSTTRQNVVKEKETTKREIPKTELEILKEKNRHEIEMKEQDKKEVIIALRVVFGCIGLMFVLLILSYVLGV